MTKAVTDTHYAKQVLFLNTVKSEEEESILNMQDSTGGLH